ncbi:uncharacterized protein LOC128547467 [Mercenaria mercenaria]|uniref:uncharacterized protein LOC128547467 n=1 Tax=Mercenaria mercenaria TaxID=6596 RepID=UPI00234F7C15|nr:uncharacterized protein LOC128547467 [Mercenaria mercenaria]
MAKTSKKELSKYLSSHLDQLGFDRRRIRERIHASNRSSRAKDISTKRILQTNEIEKIFVGSQREGIGLEYFNDLDVLQINHGIICVKDIRNIEVKNKLVFRMVQNKAPAGYTFLKLHSKEASSEQFENIKYALVKGRAGRFLSSQLFMTKNDDVFQMGDGFISKNTHYKSPQGPSIPKYVENDILKNYLSQFNLKRTEMDFVRAFPCEASALLQAWKKRERRFGWPSQKTIAYVMTLPSYVVPVGQKGSISKYLQWRISFTMAETHLVQSFNNTQTKVFVLMKLIAKYILQPVCKDISSYVVKMIMLWLAEKTSQKKFRRKHLIARLNDALIYLKTAIERKCLPSFMIPKMNLFTNKLQKQQQKRTIEKLNFLLDNGCKMITDYFGDKHANENEIDIIYKIMYAANHMDKIHTCRTALLTTQQLADYFWRIFFLSARWQIITYNILFHMGPFFFTYGKRGFSDPLSFDLSHHFAESEKKEHTALKREMMLRKCSSKGQQTVSKQRVPSPEWNLNTYVEENIGLPFEKLMCLLLYFAVCVIVLPTQIKLFLTRLVRATDSDGVISEASGDSYF